MLERRRQQQVVLEAIPAPPAGHELSLEIGLLQRDRDSAVGVEVLERDRRRVRPVDRLPGRLIRRVQADPAKVRVGIEHQANGTEAQTVRMVRISSGGCADRVIAAQVRSKGSG
jgi:hypothetical protein